MPRPSRCRRVCAEPIYDSFVPVRRAQGAAEDSSSLETGDCISLTVDEYEAIRLIDLSKQTQEQCAAQLRVSRTTVTAIYESAREKLADCLVNGKRLVISGGHYSLCTGSNVCPRRAHCRRANERAMIVADKKGGNIMRIAVTYENGNIFQHFGHTQQFKLYDIEDGRIVSTQVVDTDGQGHGALSGFLAGAKVDALICGGIGGGAQIALIAAGIDLLGGVSGAADDAVNAYLEGELRYSSQPNCSHHDHGEHSCHADTQGCGGHCH